EAIRDAAQLKWLQTRARRTHRNQRRATPRINKPVREIDDLLDAAVVLSETDGGSVPDQGVRVETVSWGQYGVAVDYPLEIPPAQGLNARVLAAGWGGAGLMLVPHHDHRGREPMEPERVHSDLGSLIDNHNVKGIPFDGDGIRDTSDGHDPCGYSR